MNSSLSEEIGNEFLSWINSQLRLEVERRAAEESLNRLNRSKWIAGLHTALVTSLSFVSIAILVCIHN